MQEDRGNGSGNSADRRLVAEAQGDGVPHVASGASEDGAGTERRVAGRLRAVVLGPRGGGTTRRRASDAFRLGFAIAVVAVSIPVMRANSAAELGVVHALNPP